MPYRNPRTGEMVTTTWDRHPPIPGKGRVWRREPDPDGNREFEYPWFYWLPRPDGVYACGSIARTWQDAMNKIQEVWVDDWINNITKEIHA